MRKVDLRTDAFTLPTEEMLEAIRYAEIGDDQYRADPTVNRLEELTAEKMGKEAALLVPSGMQANIVSLMCHTNPGDEFILESKSHIYLSEAGSFSTVCGLIPKLLKGRMGVLDPADVEAALRPSNIHYPPSKLICIENTHNRAGGTIWSPKQIQGVYEVAKAHGLALHMDGARVFNAAVALGVDVSRLAEHVDSLMFCLSKGLCAPVGSMIVGTRSFIDSAMRYRLMLGGGMRKAGIIAAAGIIAIENMVERLREDHENARLLAEGISEIPGISLDMETIQTNIVFYDVSGLGITGVEWVGRLKEDGIIASARQGGRVRMVTYRGIEREDIEYTLQIAEKLAKKIAG